jgi:hypothetical protein
MNHSKKHNYGWGYSLRQSINLAYTRPWVRSPAPQEKKKKKKKETLSHD